MIKWTKLSIFQVDFVLIHHNPSTFDGNKINDRFHETFYFISKRLYVRMLNRSEGMFRVKDKCIKSKSDHNMVLSEKLD